MQKLRHCKCICTKSFLELEHMIELTFGELAIGTQKRLHLCHKYISLVIVSYRDKVFASDISVTFTGLNGTTFPVKDISCRFLEVTCKAIDFLCDYAKSGLFFIEIVSVVSSYVKIPLQYTFVEVYVCVSQTMQATFFLVFMKHSFVLQTKEPSAPVKELSYFIHYLPAKTNKNIPLVLTISENFQV